MCLEKVVSEKEQIFLEGGGGGGLKTRISLFGYFKKWKSAVRRKSFTDACPIRKHHWLMTHVAPGVKEAN